MQPRKPYPDWAIKLLAIVIAAAVIGSIIKHFFS